MSTLCLGEALVDLVCERPVSSLADADAFVAHCGGAVANVAIAAAREGAHVALAGGVGDDAWGSWLRERLEAEGVELEWFTLVADASTPVAFVAVDGAGEPEFHIYGEGIVSGLRALGGRLEQAVQAADGLFFSSNTLVGEEERELTMRARELALAAGKPVVLDPNLRLARWGSMASAIDAVMACVHGSLLVRSNEAEAELLTGKPDPIRAAEELVNNGARLAVVSRGARGAVLRGELRAEVSGVRARVVNTMGAGDAFTGVLLGRLAATGFYPPAVAAALPDAVAAGARATERWGAL
ncbi:MAG: carbohydrate kinase family protein [Solirubrobacteraceae bacterium]|nr:MAG: hypothetical protein DLM63_11425 [Solirubrobacterales bacterium]